MKSPFNGSRLVALIAGLVTMALMIPAASAYTIHQLGSLHYAIICEDGTSFSIHSNLDGAVINAPLFCAGHGGIAGGNDGDMTVVRASKELTRDMEACQRSGGQRIKRDVIRCPKSSGLSERGARTGRLSE
ncbi:hypothetical protein HOP52_15145 [Halomonas campisalis]|uniref:Uncharacterized protein n=1 Tax=Billgrantia campisalis TaxID=74661 RepID=A0ABS9PBD9_9GAMM|nr:hypothetical protein [Halomonas campisalis]MCG6659094.1 hypothetical protein [Halomonas campisalis]MDR5863872.1 hypothetical protein [Halomonas campisalis]